MRSEQDIITQAFYLTEQDTDVWEEGDDEYELARGFLQTGISRWHTYENTNWRELLTKLSDSLTGDKVISSSHTYDCPDNFDSPGGWVRTGSTPRFWKVVPPEKVSQYVGIPSDWCYFSGDEANGFTLNFNPLVTMPEGDELEYEFYRTPAGTSDPDDEVEMSDPYFLAYFIAAHLGEDGLDQDKFTIAEVRLETMRTKNMSGVNGVPDTIDNVDDFGFGA